MRRTDSPARPLVSVFLIAPLSTKYTAPNVLRVTLFMGIICIALIGLAALPYLALLTVDDRTALAVIGPRLAPAASVELAGSIDPGSLLI